MPIEPRGRPEIALAVALLGCGQLFDYAPAVVENSSALCADGSDNDYDGRADCADSSCDCFCPEESPETCSDARDNDCDGLWDAEDPRCWLLFSPTGKRCASSSGVELISNFDAVADSDAWSPWQAAGSTPEGSAVVHRSSHALEGGSRRHDPEFAFGFNTTGSEVLDENLGALWRRQPFSGSFHDFELSFTASVPPGSLLRAGIVPLEFAPTFDSPVPGAEHALLSLTLDATQSPASLSVDVAGTRTSRELPFTQGLCDGARCAEYPLSVRLRSEDGVFRARVGYPDERSVELEAPPPPSSNLSPSRLAFWGGTTTRTRMATLDDVLLRVKPEWPCGAPVPEIPGDHCGLKDAYRAFGHGVSVAHDANGEYCALITASVASADRPELVTAWRLNGERWRALESSGLAPPDGTELVGAALAADGAGWHAAVAYRRGDDVRLSFADGARCDSWGPLEGEIALPSDPEPPSYLIVDGQHEIYFTLPPKEDTGRTLWMLSRGAVHARDTPLAELPRDVEAPVNITLVGASDRVLAYPTAVSRNSIGLLVADATLQNWQPLPSPVLELPVPLDRFQGKLAFDDRGIASAALSFGPSGGFLLYGGRSQLGLRATALEDSVLAVGTAWFARNGVGFPDASVVPEQACGNGACEGPEDCSRCPKDCACDGVELFEDAFSEPTAWQRLPPQSAASSYFHGVPPTFRYAGGTPAWSVLPLERAIEGDFELSFDTFQDAADGLGICELYVGLGTPPSLDGDTQPSEAHGIFSKLRLDDECRLGFTMMPSVLVGDRWFTSQNDERGALVECREELAERWEHVVLRREGSRVSVALPRSDSCGTMERSITYSGALDPLSALLVGHGGDAFGSCAADTGAAGTLANLKLRLLAAPDDCPKGTERCGEDCVDSSASAEHCGGCGHTCLPNQHCRGGECVCAAQPGVRSCNGVCVDTLSSIVHCGKCRNPCVTRCVDGVCDVTVGDCASPIEVPSEGGTVTLDLSAPGGTFEPLCGTTMADRWVLSFTAAREGVVRVFPDRSFLVGVTLDESCDDWSGCALASPETTFVWKALARRTYRIGLGARRAEVPNGTFAKVRIELQ